LALHIERTKRLRAGESPTKLTSDIALQLGIRAHIRPATDDSVRTKVVTMDGVLEFQRYFVESRCEPKIERILFEGASEARLSAEAKRAFDSDGLAGIIICPSNPYLSVDPILAIPGMRELLENRRVPCLAVSPLVGGKAVKGPTAKIMDELGVSTTPGSIARHYATLIDALVIDEADNPLQQEVGKKFFVAKTLMADLNKKVSLAREVLSFLAQLRNCD
jgi:LPPG:FO 2-phospho-L-lactate transferase